MTSLDKEFEQYLNTTSCLSVLKLPYKTRCMMARRMQDCQDIIHYFNYFEMMYCFFHIQNKWVEILVMGIFVIIILSYLVLMSIVVSLYFTPVLKILSLKLHLNEQIAGCTLFVIGNSAPDLVANLRPKRTMTSMFTSTVSNCVVQMLLCGGVVCFMKPFKMDGHGTVRDLLFFVLGIEMLRLMMLTHKTVSLAECIVLLSIYVIYLVVIIVDLKLMRYTIENLRKDINSLNQEVSSPESIVQFQKRLITLRKHYENNDGSILMDYEITRRIYHKQNNGKNHLLWYDFLHSLNPIDPIDWRLGSCPERLFMLIKAPMLLVVTLMVPVVDFEQNKHGWSKLLNCMQMVLNPFFLITVVNSRIANVYSSWYLEIHLEYSIWSFCLTVPFTLYMLMYTRTDLPPDYHFLFIFLSTCSCIMIIAFCVDEIEVLVSMVGVVFHISDNFMDITLGSLANATISLLATLSAVSQGYEKMAFASVIANPFFNIVIVMGLAMLFNKSLRENEHSFWVYGEHGQTCYIFLMISVVSTLCWTLTLNFNARRSVGIFTLIIFVLFVIYAVAVETGFAHEFSPSPLFSPR